MKPLFDIDLMRLESDICDIKFELSQVRYSRDCEEKMQKCSKKMHLTSKTLLSIICLLEYTSKQDDAPYYKRPFRLKPLRKIEKS